VQPQLRWQEPDERGEDHAVGETDRAYGLCQKLLSFAGPLQLYAKKIDATAGEHLGDFPQAFTHSALIEAASLLIKSEQQKSAASVG
jgi:alpha,alpha-trehalase